MWEIIRSARPADRILFAALLGVSLAGLLLAYRVVPRGNEVIIDIDGKPAYTFPVSENRTVNVKSNWGSAIVEIRDRKVRIREASCPNHLCCSQGWIDKGALVCLPTRIVVRMGEKNSLPKGVDAVTG